MRNYKVDYTRYSFRENDDWGDYDNGIYRNGHKDKNGYQRHSYVCDDGKIHVIFEHIAKWEFFNGDIENGLQIDHIIPISQGGTNKLSNLRICTKLENMNNELTRQQMSKRAKGRQLNRPDESKIIYQYSKDDKLIAVYHSLNEACRITNSSPPNVSACCHKRRKTHNGYKWSYEPL